MSTYNQIKNNKIKVVIGALFVILAATITFVWLFYGQEMFAYRDVPVLKIDITKGDEIQTDDLMTIKISRSALYDGTIFDPNELIGKSAAINLKARQPLMENYFVEPENELNGGKFIFALPSDWVYSMPQTIRRGDEISLYAVTNPKLEGKKNVITNEIIMPQAPSINPRAIVTAVVAYAKDASNREVIDTSANRINGSSNIAALEIMINQNQYAALLEQINAGNIFVVTYR